MRYYTVREANALLPALTRLLTEMQVYSRHMAELQSRADAMIKKVRGNGHHNPAEDSAVSKASDNVGRVLETGMKRLSEWSIELKDLERGLVDFPAEREGKTVYLCWQLGEPEVAYWHTLDSGFNGRLPLDDLTA